MAKYIKANRLVAEHLGLTTERNRLGDGNYMLWQADMLAFGPLYELDDTLRLIGALALSPWEAREEQDGTVVRALPVATDERFILADVADVAGVDAPDMPETDIDKPEEVNVDLVENENLILDNTDTDRPDITIISGEDIHADVVEPKVTEGTV